MVLCFYRKTCSWTSLQSSVFSGFVLNTIDTTTVVTLEKTLLQKDGKGVDSEGIRGFNRTPPLHTFNSKKKNNFHGKLQINLINLGYRIYPKYSHPLPFAMHLSSTNPFYYLWMCIKLRMSGKQCRPWSDAAYCGVWSGSPLFAQACLSEYKINAQIQSNRTPSEIILDPRLMDAVNRWTTLCENPTSGRYRRVAVFKKWP